MRTFIAYRFTGEDPAQLEPLLRKVCDELAKKKVESYCTFFDESEFKDKSLNARQIMEHAFRIIDGSDFLFVLLTSNEKSEGLLMEVGYCIAKGIPIVVAVKEGVSESYVPQMAKLRLDWSDQEELAEAIKNADFQFSQKVASEG